LGDLFYTQTSDSPRLDLQYIYDIGSWWSHTIAISETQNTIDTAVLMCLYLGTVLACPADNIGGVNEYKKLHHQLMNNSDPSRDDWGEMFCVEVRSQRNMEGLSIRFCSVSSTTGLHCLKDCIGSCLGDASNIDKRFKPIM
jgi:Plasmid pRiA4b ORF-3-like protein